VSLTIWIRNHTIKDLQQRLEAYPNDLENFLKSMVNTMNETYRQQTARNFKVLVHNETTLPVIAFYLMHVEEDIPHYAF
jgi:hypothetical protein